MLDWDHINRLRNEISAEDFSEIVDLFHGEVADVFNRVNARGATHTDMHFLKGSAANLGFVAFSKTCQITEHALREGKPNVDLTAVFDSYQKSCLQFDKELAIQPS